MLEGLKSTLNEKFPLDNATPPAAIEMVEMTLVASILFAFFVFSGSPFRPASKDSDWGCNIVSVNST